MDFQETAVQEEIRGLARKFAERDLAPNVAEDEKTERFRPELIRKLGELGLAGIPVEEEYGGAGLGYLELTAALEEMSKGSISYAISVAVTGLAQVILSKLGSEKQKKKYIPPLAQGHAIGAFSLSEAGSGSDAASLRTTATRRGDRYVIQGTKLWTTQGDIADTLIVFARTGEANSKGISAFILEKGTPGFQVGKREKKMGIHSSHTVELILNQVEVPAENLVGNEGEGFRIAMMALDSGRITIGASALGISKAALDVARSHAAHREQFGKAIGQFQGISFLLADMAVQWDAARLLVQRAAWLRDHGQAFTLEAAMAKLFSTDMAMRVTTDAVQILGGSGYTQEFPVERFMREAKVLQIVEGTNQIQRHIIGQQLTRF